MMARLASVLLLISLLSGCVAEGPVEPIKAGSAPTGKDAGTASGHGDVQRTEGDVTVTRETTSVPMQYTARKTVTLANDFGGASQAKVSLSTGAGGVAARAWPSGGYRTVVVLQVRAESESQARDELARMSVRHTDRLDGGTLTLDTAVLAPNNPPSRVSYSGLVTANLPPQPAYTLSLDTGSGGASTTGLGGPSVSADTGSGGVSIDGAFGRMEADTGSGGVELIGTANSVLADTGSGGIRARLGATATGFWSFDAGSGDVDLTIRRDGGVECDVTADNGSGDIAVDLEDGQDVGDQDDDHRHVRSAGYEDGAVRVQVQIDTGSGDISVQDA